MTLKQRLWVSSKQTKEFLTSSEFKNKNKYIKGSVLAILSGFIVASLIVAFLNVNPFVYFGKLFAVAFNPLYLDATLNWMAVYVIAGLAVAVGFKSGVFNIGAPGQILGASGMSTVVVWSILDPSATTMSGGLIFLVFLICVITAAFLAFVAGILKALFNIHEVVTTILMNWAVWYLFKYVFMTYGAKFGSVLAGNSKAIPEGMFNINGSSILIPLLIALVVVIFVAVLFAKTTFGFKLKAVGTSVPASKYSGINVKNKIVAAMTLSGALAGVAAFVSIMTVSPNTYFGSDSLPTFGFDAIAVSLVAFNNPFGMLFVGLLWGMIQTAGAPISSLFGIPTQISGLVSGIIIYLAAISAIFIKFEPWKMLKLQIYIWRSGAERKLLWKLRCQRNRFWFNRIVTCVDKDYKANLNKLSDKLEIRNFKEEYKTNLTMKMNHLNGQIRDLKNLIWDQNTNKGLYGIKTRCKNQIHSLDNESLTKIELINLAYSNFKEDLTKNKKNQIHKKDLAIKAAKKSLTKDLHAAKNWREGEIGIITLEFEYRDGVIEIKGARAKALSVINEKITSLKAELKLNIGILKNDKSISAETRKIKIKELKDTYVTDLSILHNDMKTINIEAQEKISKLKEAKAKQILRVKTEKIQMDNIDLNYEGLVREAKDKYASTIVKINEQSEMDKKNIDIRLSETKITKAKNILEQIENSISDKTQNQNKNYFEEKLKKINEAVDELNKTLTPNIIENHDDNWSVYERVKIALALFKIKTIFEIGQEMLNNKNEIFKNKETKEWILNDSKMVYIKLQQEMKEKFSKIGQENDLESINKLVDLQKQNDDDFEKYILQISNKEVA
ncbi:ribose/galactose ABC transporter permease [Williamsoniiplasma somnilux]|uniref:Ribose/galactose ABC transporter permease n=1 Tax=Williamsoniiplasma somnilux TaxID=215578 RepID=A0A2K8NXD8_9MOLU|nr:ABC transporter permease [Williamsoniiplasma somnilux]ATZ18404.1 ribose/galactose ABC transporter permease [Williamsoniiplasma somnilux]